MDGYHTEDELAEQLVSDMEAQIGLTDEPSALIRLIRSHWVNAPVFPDARAFDTDVIGARVAGIEPVLLLRGRARRHDDVAAVDDLTQALKLIFQ